MLLSKPDFKQAKQFLDALGTPEQTECFRLIPTKRKGVKNIAGSLESVWPQIEAANQQGDGVFVTINETDGEGVTGAHITSPRAVFGLGWCFS